MLAFAVEEEGVVVVGGIGLGAGSGIATGLWDFLIVVGLGLSVSGMDAMLNG